MRSILFSLAFLLPAVFFCQDIQYAKSSIKFLTSKKCFGRGYLKDGLQQAETFLVREMQQQGLKPLFQGSFTQPFYHSVNTFPGACQVKVNGKKLKPGADYIPGPDSRGAKGNFEMKMADSVTYVYADRENRVGVVLKNKLTFSVAQQSGELCEIEILKSKVKGPIKTVSIDLQNEVIPRFESKNIAGYFEGTSGSDSVIVFCAHYDHLGGIGKSTFFPGANDNASGISMVLNFIRHYKLYPPRLKTVFIFFAGEEAGLLGSKHFVTSTALELSKIKFLINLDLLGTGDDGIMVVNGAVHQEQFSNLNTINNKNSLVKEIKKRGKAANSDHYWFSEAGVPAFFIYTLGGTTSYHDVFDTAAQLPLTDYKDVFQLLVKFVQQL